MFKLNNNMYPVRIFFIMVQTRCYILQHSQEPYKCSWYIRKNIESIPEEIRKLTRDMRRGTTNLSTSRNPGLCAWT